MPPGGGKGRRSGFCSLLTSTHEKLPQEEERVEPQSRGKISLRMRHLWKKYVEGISDLGFALFLKGREAQLLEDIVKKNNYIDDYPRRNIEIYERVNIFQIR